MNHFTVYVYVKLENNLTSNINGVWAVNLPESLTIQGALVQAVRTMKYHFKEEYFLAANTVSQVLKMGAAIHNMADDDPAHVLAETVEHLPVQKVSNVIFDDMIQDTVDLKAVSDEDLMAEVMVRARSAQSLISNSELIYRASNNADARSLTINLADFNELLNDANMDADDLSKEKALRMMALLVDRLSIHDVITELTREVALELGLQSKPSTQITMKMAG